MTDRRELGKEMRRRVSGKVREVAPDGVGSWDPAIEIVRDPTDQFIDAVDAWVEEATPTTEEQVRRTATELVRAWKEAGRRFRASTERARPEERIPT